MHTTASNEFISADMRRRALQSLRKSRHFLVMGLGVRMGRGDDPFPATVSSCDIPALQLKVVKLVGEGRLLVGRTVSPRQTHKVAPKVCSSSLTGSVSFCSTARSCHSSASGTATAKKCSG